MEGQTVKYYTAFVNADGIDGFTISGKGMLMAMVSVIGKRFVA